MTYTSAIALSTFADKSSTKTLINTFNKLKTIQINKNKMITFWNNFRILSLIITFNGICDCKFHLKHYLQILQFLLLMHQQPNQELLRFHLYRLLATLLQLSLFSLVSNRTYYVNFISEQTVKARANA